MKREAAKAEQTAYDELYDRLNTKKGEKNLHRPARKKDRAECVDVQLVQIIKEKDENVRVC